MTARSSIPKAGDDAARRSTAWEAVLLGLQMAFGATVGALGKAGAYFLILILNLSNHKLTKSKWVWVKSPFLEAATKTTKAT